MKGMRHCGWTERNQIRFYMKWIECDFSNDSVAQDLNIDRRNVYKVLRELKERKKIFLVTREPGMSGRKLYNNVFREYKSQKATKREKELAEKAEAKRQRKERFKQMTEAFASKPKERPLMNPDNYTLSPFGRPPRPLSVNYMGTICHG